MMNPDERMTECEMDAEAASPNERVVTPHTVTNEMQIAAVKKAVELELIPEWVSEGDYVNNYKMIKEIVQAAIDAA